MTRAAFGSRSIALRHKPQSNTPKWVPKGSFRLFDLPPELRTHILELAILACDSHRDVLHIFQSCRRLYVEAASLFYREVSLDNTRLRLKGTSDLFLMRPLTELSPWLHVQSLIIKFCLEAQLKKSHSSYGRTLREMAKKGNLRSLRLQIERQFPSDNFWGGGDDLFAEDEVCLVSGKKKDVKVWTPEFIAKPPFQAFLKFLQDSGIPKLTLVIEAEEHYKFWCPFHRPHRSGAACQGEWPGQARYLKVNRKALLEAFAGAQVA
ncbi:hypothetical protein F4780DRAFT_709544 [Xylariomycetidae sp. FL0641]|nr:hypothetical protein F4780DRAFT_709544 [Xylariomycetidae sp. FL0641]